MSVELTTIKGGINRLRTKGKARADSLFKLTNGYVSTSGTIKRRPGTIRTASLPAGTFGLVGFEGKFHVFATSLVSGLPSDYVCHVLRHPAGSSVDLKKIHFAKPFLAALYVVAEFDNDDEDVYHFWLQQADVWEADTEYSANEFVTPTTLNGLVYRATRLGEPKPSWAANAPRTVGDFVEPTIYNEYFYEAIETEGDSPRSAGIEPIWPTNSGETIIENSDSEEADENTSASPPAPPSQDSPQATTVARYARIAALRGGFL